MTKPIPISCFNYDIRNPILSAILNLPNETQTRTESERVSELEFKATPILHLFLILFIWLSSRVKKYLCKVVSPFLKG